MFSGGSASPYRQVRDTARGTVRGYLQTAPLSYQLSQVYQPAYLGLGTNNLSGVLFGTPAQSYSQNVGWGMRDNGTFKYNTTVQQDVPASQGLFDILGMAAPRLQSLYDTGARQGVQNQLGILNDYLPQAQAYQANADPTGTALRQNIGTTANAALGMGSQWNPEDLNRVTGDIRTDWANRGLGASLPAGFAEAIGVLGGGEQLRQSRQNYALNANQSLSQTTPDYMRMILGLGGNPVGDAMSLVQAQQPLAFQGNTFDPFNSSATSASNAGLAAQQGAANNRQDILGGVAGGLFNLAGTLYNQGGQSSPPRPSYNGPIYGPGY
jgi:hypothetical protein